MKHWLLILVVILSMVMVLPSAAQDGGTLAYGDTVIGELTDEVYEVRYTFDGTAGDLVMMTLTADEYAFDTYLYLYNSSDTLVGENDDSAGLDSRLIMELPGTDTYTIVATRLDGPDGTGIGTFSLSLGIVEKINPSIPYAAEFALDGPYPVVAFMVPDDGLYNITYSQNGGDGHPNFEVNLLEGGYVTNIVYMSATKLQGASIITELDGFMLYTFELTPNYYEWDAAGTVAFSILIEMAQ